MPFGLFPAHHDHDVSSIDGDHFCETCKIDLSDETMAAIREWEKKDNLKWLQESLAESKKTIEGLRAELLLKREADRKEEYSEGVLECLAARIYELAVSGAISDRDLKPPSTSDFEKFAHRARDAASVWLRKPEDR